MHAPITSIRKRKEESERCKMKSVGESVVVITTPLLTFYFTSTWLTPISPEAEPRWEPPFAFLT
ncbi:hypothetical protein IE53DRAFT_390454 [Violaceomyces palustris]|uniref:Uncharacterized protein n=1 Tax=Violaceomyces palustris TaxID=1673888 RepID=A0ACD0NNT6_9BASI|nr:hypothetical protein IE53DRAFT_390454 [Violaceomyces palustris]